MVLTLANKKTMKWPGASSLSRDHGFIKCCAGPLILILGFGQLMIAFANTISSWTSLYNMHCSSEARYKNICRLQGFFIVSGTHFIITSYAFAESCLCSYVRSSRLTLLSPQLAYHDRHHCVVHLEPESVHRTPPQPQVLVRATACTLHVPKCVTQVDRRSMLCRSSGLYRLLLCALRLHLGGACLSQGSDCIADSSSPFSVSLIALTSKNTALCCLCWLRCASERSCGSCQSLAPSRCARSSAIPSSLNSLRPSVSLAAL